MPTITTYSKRINDYLPSFIRVNAGSGIEGFFKGIANSFVSAYNYIASLINTEWEGEGLKLLSRENHILYSGRESDAELQRLNKLRYSINNERGSLNGIITDLGIITGDRAGSYLDLDNAKDRYATIDSNNFNMKSDNLLLNADFEIGNVGDTPLSWYGLNNKFVLTDAEYYSGLKSVKLIVDSGIQLRGYQDVTAKRGAYYSISFWHNLPIGNSINLSILRGQTNDTDKSIIETFTISGTGIWSYYKSHFQFPDDTEDDVIRVQFDKYVVGSSFIGYIDDINFQYFNEFTIGIWFNMDSGLSGVERGLIQKSNSDLSSNGYGLTIQNDSAKTIFRFRLLDDEDIDLVEYQIDDEIQGGWHLAVVSVGRTKIKIQIDDCYIYEQSRTVYGDYNNTDELTLFKYADNYFRGKIGDIQFLNKLYDDDGEIANDWFNNGMQFDKNSLALWRFSENVQIGHDITENGNELVMTDVVQADVVKLESNVSPTGYPSYPNSMAFYDDKTENRGEVGWWIGRTFPMDNTTVFIGADALLYSDYTNIGKRSIKEVRRLIFNEIKPIDMEIFGGRFLVSDIPPPPPIPIDITITLAGDHFLNSTVVEWDTEEPSTSQVEYGLTESYGFKTPIDYTLVKNHRVVITGIDNRLKYHFRVISTT